MHGLKPPRTLADCAEAWAKERGEVVPDRNSPEWQTMYERWIDYAFWWRFARCRED
jgi:hypothetical protein